MRIEILKKFKIRKSVTIAILFVGMISLISFVEKKQEGKVYKDIKVAVDNEFENYFIDEEEIIRLITLNNSENIIGRKYEDINLKLLEQRIKSHKFVESAQVYKDLQGNLLAEIKQCRPIARIIQTDGPDAYIGNKGSTLNTSEKYTARVVILNGPFASIIVKPNYLFSKEGKRYLEFLKLIDNDNFLKAQIAQIFIERNGEIKLFPQVGDEIIEIGLPDDLNDKFFRLKIFYKKIIPQKGWNTYDLVNLKYKDQIICE